MGRIHSKFAFPALAVGCLRLTIHPVRSRSSLPMNIAARRPLDVLKDLLTRAFGWLSHLPLPNVYDEPETLSYLAKFGLAAGISWVISKMTTFVRSAASV